MYRLEIWDVYDSIAYDYLLDDLEQVFSKVKQEALGGVALDKFKLYKLIDLEFDVVVNIA